MKLLLRAFLLLVLVIGVLAGTFSLYAHFLLDYSLENLTAVVTATKQNSESEKLSEMARRVYESALQDMALEEASQEKVDFQNLTLFDLAGHSIKEGEAKAGYVRAGIYLNQIAGNKKPQRSALLQVLDPVAKRVIDLWQNLKSYYDFFMGKIFPKKTSGQSLDLAAYSSSLLLNQAQEKENKGLWKEAVADYEKFLKIHTLNPNRPLVAMAAANLLIRQNEYDQAASILNSVQSEFAGTSEGDLVMKALKRIQVIKSDEILAKDLLKNFKSKQDLLRKSPQAFRLGLLFLSTYRWDQAEKIFASLEQSSDLKVKTKAIFYQGWLSKLTQRYDKSAQIFSKLLEDPTLEADMEMGLRAQLADVYHQKGDNEKSAEQYEVISNKTKVQPNRAKTTRAAWASFSELEMVNIYYFNLKNSRAAREHLDKIINLAELGGNTEELELKFDQAARLNLRDIAFQALVQKRVDRALDLFTKYLKDHPNDGLAYTGLSTVYALMGDFDSAYQNAKKGYELKGDSYATLMLGYVESLKLDFGNAIQHYQQVLSMNPDSIPGRFNLAYVYLQQAEYDKALEVMSTLDQSLMLVPDKNFLRSKTLNNIGYAFWGKGDARKAADLFRKALDLTPGFEIAQHNLIQLGASQAPKTAKLIE
jgi:tetratricopeptide (TPR) repeat protein